MSEPVRLRLSRRKGFDLQAESIALNGLRAVNVARPSRWGNPHRVGADETYYGGPDCEVATAEQCVALFEAHLEARPFGLPPVQTLSGRNLACWCALDAPCHGDVLLRLANVRCEAADPIPSAPPNPKES